MACLLGKVPLALSNSAEETTQTTFLRHPITLLPTILFCLSLFAQQPKVLAPHKPIRPRLDKPISLGQPIAGSMVGGPWMIDANFKSTLY